MAKITITPLIRAKRVFRHVHRASFDARTVALANAWLKNHHPDFGDAVCVYDNRDEPRSGDCCFDRCIFVTTRGTLIQENSDSVFVPHDAIRKVASTGDKLEVGSLVTDIASGARLEFVVRGGSIPGADRFSFMRFLTCIVGDTTSTQ